MDHGREYGRRHAVAIPGVSESTRITPPGLGDCLACGNARLTSSLIAPGGPNVPHGCVCSGRVRQPVCPGASLRAADPARRIRRRRQFGDQRRTIRSRQSQGPLRPQRHRKCLKSAAAPQQHAGTSTSTNGLADTVITRCRAALSESVGADHRHDRCRARKEGTASPPSSPPRLYVHRDLPGLLERAPAS
jgi:hypothetical protein